MKNLLLKQTTIHIGIIIIVSLSMTKLFLFQPNAIIANDVDFHYARALATIHAFLDHQAIPQVDPSASFGAGYAWNLFYGPLPTYWIALVYLVSHNIAFAINLTLVLAVIAIGILGYGYLRYRTQSTQSALVAAIAMITSTSVLNNVYQYTGYGPLMAFGFSLLVFWGIALLFTQKRTYPGVLCIAFGGSGALLSHTLTCLITMFFVGIYLLCHFRTTLSVMRYFGYAALLSLGLSAFFILPFLEAKQGTLYNLFNPEFLTTYMWKSGTTLNQGRTSLSDIFFSTPHLTGFPSLLFWLTTLLVLLAQRTTTAYKQKRELFIFYGMSLLSLLLASHLIDWTILPQAFWTIQSPYRIPTYSSGFLLATTLGMSLSLIFEPLPKRWRSFDTTLLVLIFMCLANLTIHAPENLYTQEKIALDQLDQDTAIAFAQDTDKKGTFLKQAIGEFYPTAIGTTEKSLPAIVKENATFVFYFNQFYIEKALEQRVAKGPIFLNDPTAKVIYQKPPTLDHSQLYLQIPSATKERVLEIPNVYYPGYKAVLFDHTHQTKLSIKPSKSGYLAITIPKETSGVLFLYYGLSLASRIGLLITSCTVLFIALSTIKNHILNKKTAS